jgi:hypothetical protein
MSFLYIVIGYLAGFSWAVYQNKGRIFIKQKTIKTMLRIFIQMERNRVMGYCPDDTFNEELGAFLEIDKDPKGEKKFIVNTDKIETIEIEHYAIQQ